MSGDGPHPLFVPGRIEVFGKHTDYAGGRSLVTAVPLGITASTEEAFDGRVIVDDTTDGEQAVFSARGEGPVDGWRCYPSAVIRRLSRNFPGAPLSSRVRISSTLPRAAGLSSSSALVIAVAESLVARAGLERTNAWLDAIRSPEDRAGYFGCVENGADFGPLTGDRGVGTHGGSEDHAAIVMSRAGSLREFSYSPIRLRRTVAMPLAWTFVVASSGVEARKAGEVQSAYNRLAREAGLLIEAWRAGHRDDPRTLGQLAREQALAAWRPPDPLRPRLTHFLAEDARVPLAASAFARSDIAGIGDLSAASQADADRWLGNQIGPTRALVAMARALGAAAATAFGAGWGGSVWALVNAVDAERFAAEWLETYRREYPDHPSTAFVAPPSNGLTHHVASSP